MFEVQFIISEDKTELYNLKQICIDKNDLLEAIMYLRKFVKDKCEEDKDVISKKRMGKTSTDKSVKA